MAVVNEAHRFAAVVEIRIGTRIVAHAAVIGARRFGSVGIAGGRISLA